MKKYLFIFYVLIAFGVFNLAFGAVTSYCPLDSSVLNLSCDGTVKVSNEIELNNYKINLGKNKKGIAKNLLINFDLSSNDLTITTPCKITLNKNKNINSSGDVCLNARDGMILQGSNTISGNHVQFESINKISIGDNLNLMAGDLVISNRSKTVEAQIRIGEKASVTGNSFKIVSTGRASIGAFANILLKGYFGMDVWGDDDAVIAHDTKIKANAIDIETTDDLRIGVNGRLEANSELVLEGKNCNLTNKGVQLIANSKSGSCFLKSIPKGLFTIDKNEGTVPLSVSFNASEVKQAKSFLWTFDDGTKLKTSDFVINHTFQKIGNYKVALTYATETDKKGNYIYNKSAGHIEITAKSLNPIASLNCQANNLLVYCDGFGSYDPIGRPLSFEFTYWDGFVEKNQSGVSTHAIARKDAGLGVVSLKVINDAGFSVTMSVNVQTVIPPNQLPIASLDCNNDIVMVSYCWDNNSSDSDGYIVSKKFRYDDGAEDFISSSAAIRHQYANAGTHTITITVVDNDGGVSSASKEIVIRENHNPVADFVCTPQGPQYIYCYTTSTDVDFGDQLIKFDWDFGDGVVQSDLLWGTSHLYGTDGTFNVTLTAHDQFGGTNTITKPVTLISNKAPLPIFNCFIKSGSTYQCDSGAYDPDGQIVENIFYVDDKFAGNSNSIQYNFTNGGNHIVKFNVKDNLGTVASASTVIHINAPIADFNCIESSPYHIKCDYQKSENETRNIIMKRFFVDDRAIFEAESFEYDFIFSGKHIVKLDLYDTDGSKASIQKDIQINPYHFAPLPDFTSFADLNLKVRLDGSDSYKQGRQVVSFSWDFGDGDEIQTTPDAEIFHTYKSEGYYDVKLTVVDDRGVSVTTTKKTYIYDAAVPDPGDNNNITAEGIDINNNGIRDDVERWIAYEAKDNTDKKIYLNKLAIAYQNQLIDRNDTAKVIGFEQTKDKLKTCLLGKLDDDEEANYLFDLLNYLYSSTEERSKAMSIIEGNLVGYSFSGNPSDQASRLLSCEGI